MSRFARAVAVIAAIGVLSGCSSFGEFDVRALDDSGQTVDLASRLDYSRGIPWRPGQFQYGVDLNWTTVGTDEEVAFAADRAIDYVTSLGANALLITFPIYVDGVNGDRVYAGAETPTPDQLAIVVEKAKSAGLRVTVQPEVDETVLSASGAWRGSLEPADRYEWFNSYRTLLLEYATGLDDTGVDELVLGKQFTSFQDESEKWAQIDDAISGSFSGQRSYSMNWDAIVDDLPVESFGVQAYPPVPLDDDATVDQLTEAIKGWLNTLPVRVRMALTIQGAGIPAVSGAYEHPWSAESSTEQDLMLQARWFEAMIKAAMETGVQGVYFEGLDSSANPSLADPVNDPATSFVGRPAQDVLQLYYLP